MKHAQTADDSGILHIPDTDSTRSEVRQFVLALAGMAFVLSTLGTRSGGPMAFAADIVLVLCGAWCANQLIRGLEILRRQVICVAQSYFVGLLCCSFVLFVVGWLIFLPSEYLNLGRSLLFAATFTTNFSLAFLPATEGLRFDGLLDHLWVPALVAQCCIILAGLYWLLRRNTPKLLLALGGIAIASLVVSTAQNTVIHLLPIGGLWAFLCGAIPFFASHRYPVLRYALVIGIINTLAGVLAISATGDTLFSRLLFALGVAFLYLGSRPVDSPKKQTVQRRRWFGMALHMFLWAIPLAQISAGLNAVTANEPDYFTLLIGCVLLAIASWSLWQHIESRVQLERITPTAVVAAILLANGVITLSAQGLQLRYSPSADAYLRAMQDITLADTCPEALEGPLAGLAVCTIGTPGSPTVLIWGDHQLLAMKPGFQEAATRAGVSALLIGQADCVPVGGLQTRLATPMADRSCEGRTAQVLQALPYLPDIRHVTLVADWLLYGGQGDQGYRKEPPVLIGPNTGAPLDVTQQARYLAETVEDTVNTLDAQGLRVTILRQVPVQPRFDAELAARAEAPGAWLYHGFPDLADSASRPEAEARNAVADDLFRRLAAKGKLTYLDTWPAFCSENACSVRGGLSSDYATATRLTRSGALALSAILTENLERSRTHAVVRRNPTN